MKFFALLLLLPLSLFASAFDPIRLDPGADGDTIYYYPSMNILPNGNVLAQWSSVSEIVGAYGREATESGNLAGDVVIYDEEEYGIITCPPYLQNLNFFSGGKIRFIHHA